MYADALESSTPDASRHPANGDPHVTTSSSPTVPFALARFASDTGPVPGLVVGDRIRQLSAEELGAESLNEFLAAGEAAWDRIAALAALAETEDELADAAWQPL